MKQKIEVSPIKVYSFPNTECRTRKNGAILSMAQEVTSNQEKTESSYLFILTDNILNLQIIKIGIQYFNILNP